MGKEVRLVLAESLDELVEHGGEILLFSGEFPFECIDRAYKFHEV